MTTLYAWTAQLPPMWRVERLKAVAELRNSNVDKKSYDDGIPVRLCNYTDVYYNEFVTSQLELMEATATPAEIARFALKPGDVIITKDSETWNDIAVPACVAEELPDVVCGYHLALVRPRPGSLDGRFLLRALQATGVRDHFWVSANGVTRFGLTQHGMKNAPIPVPPLELQGRIADFLDQKTAAIDELIAKKERLVELLAEKRQALITQAVTKGLDPNAPMKDSAVARFGQIPRHWELVSLRRVGRVDQGNAFAHALQGQDSGRFPWFKVADMNRPGNEIEMVTADNYVDHAVVTQAQATILSPGAVIFPRVGAALLTNKRRVLTRPSIVDDNTYAVIPNGRIRSRFLFLSLLLVDMAEICSAGLVPTVTFSAIKELPIALPPLAEQDHILRRIEAAYAVLDALLGGTRRSIGRLREYRQALITAAVTGQLDVSTADSSTAVVDQEEAQLA